MGYKDDCAQAAQAQADGNAQLERQRQREMEAQRDALKAQTEAREAQQKREEERMEKLEKVHEGDLAAMLTHQKEQRAANQERADKLQREQEDRIKEAIKEGSDALDKQRNFNQTESQSKTRDHQNLITKKEAQLAETEKKAEEKVLVLKQQKEELQDKLNQDKQVYHDKMMAAGEQHALKMDEHHKKTAELEMQQHQDALDHVNKIAGIKLFSQTTKIAVTNASANDVKESSFADSVSNTRAAATEVSRAVGRLESSALSLRPDKPPPPRIVATLKATNERIVQHKLANLTNAATDIRDQQESGHSKVLECQTIANDIVEATTDLTSSISEFMGIFEYEGLIADDMSKARDLFRKVQDSNRALQTIVASLPTIVKSQHAIGALIKSTQAIQLGGTHGGTFIQHTETVGAIMNTPGDQ